MFSILARGDPHRPYQNPNVLIGFSGQEVPEVPKGTSWVGKYRIHRLEAKSVAFWVEALNFQDLSNKAKARMALDLDNDIQRIPDVSLDR